MSAERHASDRNRRGATRGCGWTGSDSRDGARAAADADLPADPLLPAAARPVVSARGRTVITPNGFPLYL